MLVKLLAKVIILTYGLYLPIFYSHKALEQGKVEDLKKWLVHWVTYVLFSQALYITNAYFGSWLPFYNIIVLTTFLWLINPQFNGGRYFYENHLKVFLSKHESTIESLSKSIGKYLFKFTIKAGYEMAGLLKTGLIWIVKRYGDELTGVCDNVLRILVVNNSAKYPDTDQGEPVGDGFLVENRNDLSCPVDSMAKEHKPRTGEFFAEDQCRYEDFKKNCSKPRSKRPKGLGHAKGEQNSNLKSRMDEPFKEDLRVSGLMKYRRPTYFTPGKCSVLQNCNTPFLMIHKEIPNNDADGLVKNEVISKAKGDHRCVKSPRHKKKATPSKIGNI